MENVSLENTKVVKSPKDIVLDGAIVSIQTMTWREIAEQNNLSEEKRNKFPDLDEKRLVIKFQTSYEGMNFTGETNVKYYETPTDNCAMGKILNKYSTDVIKVGGIVKVFYNDKGIGDISY